MKIRTINFWLISSLLYSLPQLLNAAMVAYCNDKKYTQYICCPANGGWIISPNCNPGAASYCVKDNGPIANSNPQISILQECINRGGTAVNYPF